MASPTTLLALSLIALLLVFIGLVSGWVLSETPVIESKSKLKTMIAVAITVVWIIVTIADMLLTGYSMSPLIHALMGGLVGYFFTDEGIQFNIGGGE